MAALIAHSSYCFVRCLCVCCSFVCLCTFEQPHAWTPTLHGTLLLYGQQIPIKHIHNTHMKHFISVSLCKIRHPVLLSKNYLWWLLICYSRVVEDTSTYCVGTNFMIYGLWLSIFSCYKKIIGDFQLHLSSFLETVILNNSIFVASSNTLILLIIHTITYLLIKSKIQYFSIAIFLIYIITYL